ncbi:KilA-N domain-containing protein [Elizabethkingia meningoseptica]|uniref:KilA-N domain-containing protein n=1 Tax=Elizabethkingia meningoseptica TaxID=238 RepID=UPI003891A6F2
MNTAEMAKPFGKNSKDWTRLQSTQEFVNAYKSAKGHISLLEVTKGGNASGTWMHEDLALEFAC